MPPITAFNSSADVAALNEYLEIRSYIESYAPSQADNIVFDALSKSSVDRSPYGHVLRWFSHISSFGGTTKSFPGQHKSLNELNIPAISVQAPTKKEEDDLDLFGSDEEEDTEAEALKAQRLATYNAKRANKPQVLAKSSVIIDVKPWEDTTDLVAMEAVVRAVQMDGLIWGTAKLVPIGYGIKKLQISCAIEDAKVSMDSVEELIMVNEELVQSVDIVAFNKI